MISILFVCYGNICRSPMAEFLFRELVAEKKLAGQFLIESAAVSDEELGNPVYPPIRALLRERGISTEGKSARQVRRKDYGRFDYIVGMDHSNLRDLKRLFGADPQNKVSLLLDYTDQPRDVADPWYTRDFRTAQQDITLGCNALLQHILNKH